MPELAQAASAPTVLLLHGATLNGHMWDPLRRFLDPRYHVLAPNLPGHGSRRDQQFSLERAVEVVQAAAQAAPPGPLIVGGDSLGGYTTMAAAAALPPERVAGLVLCGWITVLKGMAMLPYYRQIAVFQMLLALLDEKKLVAKLAPKMVTYMRVPPQNVDAMVAAGISLRVFQQAVRALRGIFFRTALQCHEAGADRHWHQRFGPYALRARLRRRGTQRDCAAP